MGADFLELVSLFFFSMATAGFILFMVKYRHSNEVRIWGIRASHAFGFIGVFFMRLSDGLFTEPALLIISSLLVSCVAFELANRYLEPG